MGQSCARDAAFARVLPAVDCPSRLYIRRRFRSAVAAQEVRITATLEGTLGRDGGPRGRTRSGRRTDRVLQFDLQGHFFGGCR